VHTRAVDVLDLRRWLRIETAERDEILAGLLEQAYRFAEHECGILLLEQSITEVRDGDGTSSLLLNKLPVVRVTTVTLDGEEVTESTGFGVAGWMLLPVGNPYKLFYRDGTFTAGEANLEVEYVAGAAPTADMRMAIIELAGRKYKRAEFLGQSGKNFSTQSVSYDDADVSKDVQQIFDRHTWRHI